ncbi:hypothetical protein [Helicobacter pylori]|uniref:hypothetical protein n=1 Tax=Helicobacter pylori TaxID=210 RepID=UPI002AC5CE96|nr:hypothetical protein [Helicobacter pylori]MDZ5288553.1 hypothetical protein [Helicobacter pylori]
MPFKNNEQLKNQREIISRLDTMQGDFRLISADVQGIKKSLDEHKRDTTISITEQDKKIDVLKDAQTRTETALTTLKMSLSAFAVIVVPVTGWYLSSVNASVKVASETSSRNQQIIENIQKVQDERKAMIVSIDERLGRMKDELIQYRGEATGQQYEQRKQR